MSSIQQQYLEKKQERRENKRISKRGDIQGEDVIFIFEKILDNCKTISIYNTLVQKNKLLGDCKKKVEQISTGNCKVYENELTTEEYDKYIELRKKVYEYQINKKNIICSNNYQ